MSLYPERPDVIASEVWHYDDKQFRSSTTYIDMLGHSPEITNHISTTSFKIINGVGAIATEGMVTPVTEGSEVTIFPGTRYWYSGELSMLVTHSPVLCPDFVTMDNQKLSRENYKLLRRVHRAQERDRFIQKLTGDIDTFVMLAWKINREQDTHQQF
jgi:hypothetical protein